MATIESTTPKTTGALAGIKARAAAIRRRRQLGKERGEEVARLNAERDALRAKITVLKNEAERLENADHTPEKIREAAIRLAEIPLTIKLIERSIAAIADPPPVREGEPEAVTQGEANKWVDDVIAAFTGHRCEPLRAIMATWGGKAPADAGFINAAVLGEACPYLGRLNHIRRNIYERGLNRDEVLGMIESAE